MGFPGGTGPPPMSAQRGSALPCSEPGCTAADAVPCSYVDRRQRACPTAWCSGHKQTAFNALYCRRHAGIIEALGADHLSLPMPDLENRAPSLANWVGRDLDMSVRTLLETHFAGHAMNVTDVVTGGSRDDRTWGRSWKLISAQGVDLSVSVAVPEADDSLVRVIYDGRVLTELTPPWIEGRRQGVAVDPETDSQARLRFYDCIVRELEAAVIATKRQSDHW